MQTNAFQFIPTCTGEIEVSCKIYNDMKCFITILNPIELDPLKDIISNITLGQTIPAGTGRTHFIVDPEYRKAAKQNNWRVLEEFL